MTTTRKTSYWYHELDEAIPVMVKLKQVVMHFIELIQESNITDKFRLRYKRYAYMNPHLLSENNHKIMLDIIEARENINHDDYTEDENLNNVDSDDYDDDDI